MEQYVKATRLIEHLKSQRDRSKRAFDKAMDLVLKYDARIAELEAERDQAKAIVSRLRDFLFDYTQFHISTNPEERWWALVDKFDELTKELQLGGRPC